MKIHKGILFLVAVAFLSFAASSGNSQVDNKKGIRTTTLVVRYEGWTIPKSKPNKRWKTRTGEWEGTNVVWNVLTALKPIVKHEDYFIDSEKELTISRKEWKITSFSSASVKTKIFAYGISYTPWFVPDMSVGALMLVWYVDRNGDGLFEARYINTDKPPLPQWVKDL